MRRAWAPYLLGGLVLYGLFLSTLAPPMWIAWGVARISGGAVTLADVRGTFWSGTGSLIAPAKRRDIGLLRWRINPAWLFLGQVTADIDLSNGEATLSGKVRVGLGGVRIPQARARFTPAFAALFYSPLSLVDPKGDIELRVDRLSLSPNALHGRANVVWRNAVANMSDVRPLGDYELKANGYGRTVDFALLTHSGQLNLTGKGSWQPFDGGQLAFSGVAKAAGRKAELARLLAVLGAQGTGDAPLLIRSNFALR